MRQRQQTGSAGGWILIFVIAVILALGGYWYYIPSERPWWVDTFMPDLVPARQNVQLYKWKDSNGRWQYSNSAPPAGVKYETVDYVEDANVMPSDPANQD
jgi:hypothetical protein